MSNAERGHVRLVADGVSYRLQLTLNAMACIKSETGMSLQALIAKLDEQGDDVDLELIGVVLWASMQDHQPELTQADVMKLNPDGGLEEMLGVIETLFERAFPKSSAAGASGKNPQTAAKKNRTSPRS
ncbi:GTA-gp10 family protein [Neoaquamicrobium sediminum]|uniref:GTA-gp10 family protein n=1 Tax=Neoaquamicrobium sediminum TaxID=1849104 RepID=UPI003BAC5DEC